MAGETKEQVFEKIAEQTTIVGGLKVYNDDLRSKLAAALAAGQLVSQADLERVFADVSANNQTVAEAMIENVTV